MASANNSRKIAVTAAVFVATVALVWFGNGLTPWWPLTWFALLPLFWFSLRSGGWSTAVLAFTSWLAGSVSMLGYFYVLHAPFTAWLANFGPMSVLAALGVLIFRALVLRRAVWTAIMAPAALWVSLDWARYGWTPHGTAADLAYTQLSFLPFLQLASLTGPWGMSFLLVAFPAAIAVALHLRKSDPQRARRVAGALACIVVLVLGYGTLRLLQPDQPNTLKVGLITSDLPENDKVVHAGADAERLLTQYAAQASNLAARGARIIVMPEKLAVVRDSDTPADDAILQSVANATGAILVAGELQLTPNATGTDTLKYNRAKVYRPQAPVSTYNKEHLLPPMESDETPGTEKLLFKSGPNTLGVAICKDMDFTSMSLAYADLGAQLMLVPGWDFSVDTVWHGRMAIMRGVEAGFSVARAAKESELFVSDDRGRVLAATPSNAAPFATLLADVPVGHEPTLFQRWGNGFAWVAVTALVASLARLAALLFSSSAKAVKSPGDSPAPQYSQSG